MPTFNSCTKCAGSTGIIHDRLPDGHPVSWAWMQGFTSQLNIELIHKLRGPLMCLANFSKNVTHGCFYNQALADVRLTGAGIEYLYCMMSYRKNACCFKFHTCCLTFPELSKWMCFVFDDEWACVFLVCVSDKCQYMAPAGTTGNDKTKVKFTFTDNSASYSGMSGLAKIWCLFPANVRKKVKVDLSSPCQCERNIIFFWMLKLNI